MYGLIVIGQVYKIIQLNEWGCRDGMHQQAKNRGNKGIPLAILSTILPHSCVTLFWICWEGLCMIVLVPLIVLLRGFPCFYDFSHGVSHTSPFILCPCSAYLRIYKRKYTHVRASIRELVDSGMAYYTFLKSPHFRF